MPIYWTTRRMRGTRRRISNMSSTTIVAGDAIDAIDCKHGGRRREAGHLDDSCSRGSIWAGSLSASYSNTNATNRDVGGGSVSWTASSSGDSSCRRFDHLLRRKVVRGRGAGRRRGHEYYRTRRALSYAASRANAMNENTNTLKCDIGPIERW
jgi:hypothetical protein